MHRPIPRPQPPVSGLKTALPASKRLFNLPDRHPQQLPANRIKGRLGPRKVKHTMPMYLRLPGSKKGCRRYALQFEERSHLTAIRQRPVIIGIDGIPAEGWL